MTRYLCAVLASVGVGGTEDGDQHLVDCGGCMSLWHSDRLNDMGHSDKLNDMAVVDGVWLGLGEVLGEYTRKNLKRLRA